MAIFPGSAIPSAVSAYDIDNSLRFSEGSSGGKLTRTQGTPTGSKAFTYSFWFKGKTDMAGLNDDMDFGFLDASSADNDFISLGRQNGTFAWALRGGTGDGGYLVTTEELRDPSAWYHMVVTMNSAESTDSDRMKMYKNGVQITAFSTENYCAEDYVLQNFNTSGVSLKIGQETGSYPGGAYMAEVYFIDGLQYDADDFGELDSDTNQWIPKDASGLTFGDNGFYQKYGGTELADSFADSSASLTFTPTEAITTNILLVAGGGGGQDGFGGGGGAGGIWYGTSYALTAKSYDVIVGAGGQGGSDTAGVLSSSAGGNTTFDGKIGYGGGGTSSDRSGGSGQGAGEFGGAGSSTQTAQGGTGYGTNGGAQYSSGHLDNPGGGGGASVEGHAGTSSKAGDGGAGQAFTITGASVTYGGGGGGGSRISVDDEGAGGAGGGGAGAGDASETATAGTNGLGGGGGGGGQDAGAGPHPSSDGAQGGSGIAIISYISTTVKAAGGTITSYVDGSDTYQVHSFTQATHTITAVGDATNTRAVRKIGDSTIKLDGSDYLTASNSPDWDFGTGEFTLEMWARYDATATTSFGFISNNSYAGGGWQLYYDGAGDNYFHLYATDQTDYDLTTSTTPSADTWYHYAVTRQSDTLRFYIDGVQQTSQAFTEDMSNTPALLVVGGSSDRTDPQEIPACHLDEIRISNTNRYPDGTTFTPNPDGAFTADANTKLLIHSNWDGGLGADSSGNYNTFTATNLVATNQMPDTPTNNFATWNPLAPRISSGTVYGAWSEGNLEWINTSGSVSGPTKVTFSLGDSTKIYCEILAKDISSADTWIGLIAPSMRFDNISGPSFTGTYYTWNLDNGNYYVSGSSSASGVTAVDGDIVQIAYDPSTGKMWFGKNNTWNGSGDPAAGTNAAQTLSGGGELHPNCGGISDDNFVGNFGQDSSFAGNKTSGSAAAQDSNEVGDFYYAPPSGFLALCTSNLPSPEIALPGDHFNTVLYTGNGSTQSITGVGFQPDVVWIKDRDDTESHHLYDAVRGATETLLVNQTQAEFTGADRLTSFDSDGFSLGSNDGVNKNTDAIVAWNWKAGGSGSANTTGTIDSTVSTNTTAGFSIVKWTGTGSAGTIGHGLSETPNYISLKNLTDVNNWFMGSSFLENNDATNWYDWMFWNLTNASGTFSSDTWNDTAPTASVFSVNNTANSNGTGKEYIAYCWHSVEGYSKVGSYTGNGNADGPFVYTGFKPKFVIVKNSNLADDWEIYDGTMNPYNYLDLGLKPNTAGAEYALNSANRAWDFVSNGFKVRGSNGGINQSGDPLIYIAFAESPFKTANAR